jgi:transposase
VPAAEHLYAQYDALAPVRAAAEKALVEEAHRHAITKVLETCPGLGPIRVAQIVATVVSPQRFRTRQQFWSYCGLGIVMRIGRIARPNTRRRGQRREPAPARGPRSGA